MHPVRNHQLEGRVQVRFRGERPERYACHHLADRGCRPRVVGQVLGVSDAHDSHQSPAFDNRQRALTVPHGVLEYEVLHAERGFGDSRRRVHDRTDGHPTQDVAHSQLLAGRLRARIQEPADERGP